MKRLHEPVPMMYSGLSVEQAFRKAEEIIEISDRTGQTVLAEKHLDLIRKSTLHARG